MFYPFRLTGIYTKYVKTVDQYIYSESVQHNMPRQTKKHKRRVPPAAGIRLRESATAVQPGSNTKVDSDTNTQANPEIKAESNTNPNPEIKTESNTKVKSETKVETVDGLTDKGVCSTDIDDDEYGEGDYCMCECADRNVKGIGCADEYVLL
jgi:hypothetical protein